MLYSWHVYYENADTDEPRRFIGLIEEDTMALALQKASEFYEYPSHDLVVKRSAEVEQGTFEEVYAYSGKAWTTFGNYGAIVVGVFADSPKRLLNLAENIHGQNVSRHLEEYQTQEEMFTRLVSLGLPENAVWHKVKEEE